MSTPRVCAKCESPLLEQHQGLCGRCGWHQDFGYYVPLPGDPQAGARREARGQSRARWGWTVVVVGGAAALAGVWWARPPLFWTLLQMGGVALALALVVRSVRAMFTSEPNDWYYHGAVVLIVLTPAAALLAAVLFDNLFQFLPFRVSEAAAEWWAGNLAMWKEAFGLRPPAQR